MTQTLDFVQDRFPSIFVPLKVLLIIWNKTFVIVQWFLLMHDIFNFYFPGFESFVWFWEVGQGSRQYVRLVGEKGEASFVTYSPPKPSPPGRSLDDLNRGWSLKRYANEIIWLRWYILIFEPRVSQQHISVGELKNKEQDHLRMNVAPDLNNQIRSIDLFTSMIIKKNRSKVCDSDWIVIGSHW